MRAIDWGLQLLLGFGEGAVHNIDAMSLLKQLKPESVGMVILDPPGNFGIRAIDDDVTSLHEQVRALKPLAKLIKRVLRPGAPVVLLSESRIHIAWDIAATELGLKPAVNMVVVWHHTWNRAPSALPTHFSNISWHVAPGHRVSYNPNVKSITLDSNIIHAVQVHPSDRHSAVQRPIELFRYLITALTFPRDLVVDPFCGTGSALMAAEMSNRAWVGCDTSKDMCLISDYRLSHLEVEVMDMHDITPIVNGHMESNRGNQIAYCRK